METTVKQRLMEFIRHKNLSQNRFEKAVGLSNGYVNNISKGLGASKLAEISQCFPDLNTDWLLTGKGNMLNDSETVKETEKGNDQSLPLIPIDAMAGFLSGDSTTVMEYECERYVVPAFKHADYLIRVQGDSMTPKYESGDIIACKRVPLGGLWFQWGKAYVLDTAQGALVKRIEPSETDGMISLHSENPKYRPFDLPVEEIYGVALVVGTIRVEG